MLTLALAIVNAIVRGSSGTPPAAAGSSAWRPAVAVAFFALTAHAFAALVYADVVSDFSLINVAANSALLDQPLLYKPRRHLGQPRGVHAAVGPHR